MKRSVLPLLCALVGASHFACTRSATTSEVPASDPLLRCRLFYRQSNSLEADAGLDDARLQFEERSFDVRANGVGEVSLAGMRLYGQYSRSPEEGIAFKLGVDADQKPVMSLLRQFDRSDPVLRKFGANHGFTGLVYVTHPERAGDYQFFCGTAADAAK